MKTQKGISYDNRVTVYLDGKRVGEIREAFGGFAYWPNQSKTPGDTFPTIEAVKRSLEAS